MAFIGGYRFKLSPFAFWSGEDWADKGPAYNEIRDNMLGWDITVFGSIDSFRRGLLMFTIRNGNFDDTRRTIPTSDAA